jgi:hypothetical protein
MKMLNHFLGVICPISQSFFLSRNFVLVLCEPDTQTVGLEELGTLLM